MEVSVLHSRSGKQLTTLNVPDSTTIGDLKKQYHRQNAKYYPERQSYRTEARGKMLKDEVVIGSLGLGKKGQLYFKDLGPQVGWSTAIPFFKKGNLFKFENYRQTVEILMRRLVTSRLIWICTVCKRSLYIIEVFLTEYAGPLVIYLMFYVRPACVYGAAITDKRADVVNIAAACWTVHYAKRLLETVFVHRFSHATMPLLHIFRNSSYYWGFAAFVAYFVNHPLYTPPAYGTTQIYGGLALFIFAELGNLSIHLAFKHMRPAGSKVRKIPLPTANPFTWMFNFVSCPNYTYEALAWVGFFVLTQCLPAALFTAAGFYQMTVWAIGKHKNYKKEFSSYPRGRTSIVPFII